jgi:hypothetical protein
MTNMNDYISDEMLAAYIEGTSTPLENMIIEQQLNDENICETIEIASEYDEADVMDNIEAIDISKTIDDYLKPFDDFKELKKDIDNGSEDVVL